MSAAILARVQQAARIGRVILSPHAEQEAEDANVQARDIENAIRTAAVAIEQDGNRIRLEGGVGIDHEP